MIKMTVQWICIWFNFEFWTFCVQYNYYTWWNESYLKEYSLFLSLFMESCIFRLITKDTQSKYCMKYRMSRKAMLKILLNYRYNYNGFTESYLLVDDLFKLWIAYDCCRLIHLIAMDTLNYYILCINYLEDEVGTLARGFSLHHLV